MRASFVAPFNRVLQAFALVVAVSFAESLAFAAPAQQAYVKASNTGGLDAFGSDVALSDDTMVVGAAGESSNATGVNGDQNNNNAQLAGAAYVFVRNGSNWSQQAYLKPFVFRGPIYFGNAVAISGDTVLVGAPNESSDTTGVNGNPNNNNAIASGAAYVFVRNGSNWTPQAFLKASNTGPNDNFGLSVAISADILVVGAPYEMSLATGVNGDQNDNNGFWSGAAYVFVRTGTNWSQQAYLKPSNIPSTMLFGDSVAIWGETIIVGGEGQGDASGAAYVFVRNGTNWSQQAMLKASNAGRMDQFGRAVAIWRDTVIVGSVFEDSDATGVNGDQINNSARDSGAAYVFTRSGTTWLQQAYLKASNTESNDYFGNSVSVGEDIAVIGAYREKSNAVGVNGNQSDNSAASAGAAYAFVRRGTNWSQQAYLKASNTDPQDYFGLPVCVWDTTAVVAAWQEGCSSTGINGNQSDNTAFRAGAVYVFTGLAAHSLTFPLILSQPLSLIVTQGDGARFSVEADGTSPISYQWRRNGMALLGATNESLLLNNVQWANGGAYSVVLSNSFGLEESAQANLFVRVKPEIIQPPLSQRVAVGERINFSVSVSEATPLPLTYQWRRNGFNVFTTTNAQRTCFYSVTNESANAAYSVLVSNIYWPSPIVSANAFVTLLPDTDHDGLPDEYELAHGLNPNDPSDALLDTDGDGVSNANEYVGGTDLDDPSSHLKLEPLGVSDANVLLTFFAISNKTYSVQFKSALESPDWLTLTNIGTRRTNSPVLVTDSVSPLRRFYRIATPRQP